MDATTREAAASTRGGKIVARSEVFQAIIPDQLRASLPGRHPRAGGDRIALTFSLEVFREVDHDVVSVDPHRNAPAGR